MALNLKDDEHTLLEALSAQYPNADAALAEVAALRACLKLPKRVVHVISDVHGEYRKLRHVINNASGFMRPLVREIFAGRLTRQEQRRLLSVLYYPREVMDSHLDDLADPGWRRDWVGNVLRQQFELVRHLARNYRRKEMLRLIPVELQELFIELLNEAGARRSPDFINVMLDALHQHGRDLHAVRSASRLVRNLAVSEIIVDGDLGDRGQRIDMVIDYLMQQPKVTLTWGNHDVSWMGACMGQRALIATVLRFSLRYRRLFQLEEGYGILLLPLERLAREIYGEDPCERFASKNRGMRDPLQVARMQKAITIIQLKLEGQTIRRHPEWEMEDRNRLHLIDFETGTVRINGQDYPLRDTHLPTVDPDDPYRLSAEEADCMERLRESFITSSRLWQHMNWVVNRGGMYLTRDRTAIFHACIPVDDDGQYLPLRMEGGEVRGKAMFDAFDTIVRRAYRRGAQAVAHDDADWFYYLWAGHRSPLFGKDRMATFEGYFLDEPETHEEIKNPYFRLIHDDKFAARIAAEFGLTTPDALVVNGHVPVKVDKGEKPLKQGGNAVTIDGAFSEAYGDRGYTLVLGPDKITLAEHHHMESIEEVIEKDADIVPDVQTLRQYPGARLREDTEEGKILHKKCQALERLIQAYREGEFPERSV